VSSSQPAPQPAPDSPSAPRPEDRQRALALFRQALTAADANDHRKALELLDSAITLDPTDPDFFNNRGNAQNGLGNPKKALDDYTKAISLKPRDPAYLCNRGVVFEQLGEDAPACRDYRAACELGDCDFFHSFRKKGAARNRPTFPRIPSMDQFLHKNCKKPGFWRGSCREILRGR
jgi:Flp pilus assembly protein TadD